MPSTVFKLLGALALLAGTFGQPGPESKQSVDEIVASTLKARGGVDALRAVTAIKRTGHTTLSGSQVPVTVWTKRPNLFRREMELPTLLVILGYDGKTFWTANARDGAGQPGSGPAMERAQEEAAFDTVLLDYKAKGHKVALVGTVPQGKTLLYHLKVTKKNGKVEDYYVDAKTGLEARMVSMTEMAGQKVELAKEFSDYRKVSDIVVPFIIRDFANGTLVSETTLDQVEVNPKLDDALFRMPVRGQ